MQKVLIALMAMGGSAFAPSAHQRATVVQQGVPLANGAMEFDRAAPASGMHRCAATTCVADARAPTRAAIGTKTTTKPRAQHWYQGNDPCSCIEQHLQLCASN